MNLWSTERDALFELVAPHVGRARSLTIHGTISDLRAVFSHVFHSPAPLLQHLEIKEDFLCRTGPSDLPDDFLCQHAPALRSVSFKNTFPTFESHLPLPNLTRFELTLEWCVGTIRLSVLLQVLSTSAQLREVSIHATADKIQDIPNNVVSLESLEELECHGGSGIRVPPG
jgi:hypothetical protein